MVTTEVGICGAAAPDPARRRASGPARTVTVTETPAALSAKRAALTQRSEPAACEVRTMIVTFFAFALVRVITEATGGTHHLLTGAGAATGIGPAT